MKNFEKYSKQYFLPKERCMDWAEKDAVEKAPVWCSVDLRDGNQSLIEPMSLETKVEFFKLLLEIGFKEIEVGFPAASETEYDFLRKLIDDDLIPDDVTIQVLTQAREHIIRKTFDAVRGAKNVIVHVYNSTSVAQREQVFKKDKEDSRRRCAPFKGTHRARRGKLPLRVFPRIFHGHRARVCARSSQRRSRRMAAHARQEGGYKSARHG